LSRVDETGGLPEAVGEINTIRAPVQSIPRKGLYVYSRSKGGGMLRCFVTTECLGVFTAGVHAERGRKNRALTDKSPQLPKGVQNGNEAVPGVAIVGAFGFAGVRRRAVHDPVAAGEVPAGFAGELAEHEVGGDKASVASGLDENPRMKPILEWNVPFDLFGSRPDVVLGGVMQKLPVQEGLDENRRGLRAHLVRDDKNPGHVVFSDLRSVIHEKTVTDGMKNGIDNKGVGGGFDDRIVNVPIQRMGVDVFPVVDRVKVPVEVDGGDKIRPGTAPDVLINYRGVLGGQLSRPRRFLLQVVLIAGPGDIEANRPRH